MQSAIAALAAVLIGTTAGTFSVAAADKVKEFRGAWVATVYNLDWPSKPGLPAAEQKAQLRRLLDGAAAMKLNAILLPKQRQNGSWEPGSGGQEQAAGSVYSTSLAVLMLSVKYHYLPIYQR